MYQAVSPAQVTNLSFSARFTIMQIWQPSTDEVVGNFEKWPTTFDVLYVHVHTW